MTATDLGTTLDSLLACLCEALATAGRPTCDCGITVGPPMLSPAQCCDCGDAGGQLSVTVQRMYPADPVSFAQVARLENCHPGGVAADLQFTLARCHPTIDMQGNPPTLEQVGPYADGLADDLQTLWNALVCCDTPVVIRDAAVDIAPNGGCTGIGVRVSVMVKPVTPVVDVS